jgi:hypothetical protein
MSITGHEASLLASRRLVTASHPVDAANCGGSGRRGSAELGRRGGERVDDGGDVRRR